MLMYLIIAGSVPVLCSDDPVEIKTHLEKILAGKFEPIANAVYVYKIPMGRPFLPGQMNTRTGPESWGDFMQLFHAERSQSRRTWQENWLDDDFSKLEGYK